MMFLQKNLKKIGIKLGRLLQRGTMHHERVGYLTIVVIPYRMWFSIRAGVCSGASVWTVMWQYKQGMEGVDME